MDTTMGELVNPSPPPRVLTLIAQELTPEAFLPYGQVVRPVADNANYGPDDAQLDLSRGVPRNMMMHKGFTLCDWKDGASNLVQ